jgi:hypothetical protein
VKLGRCGLCSAVSRVGGIGSMLVLCLISFVVLAFASDVSCKVGGVVVRSLARRLSSVAMLRSVMPSLWTIFVQKRRLILFAERGGVNGKESCGDAEPFRQKVLYSVGVLYH